MNRTLSATAAALLANGVKLHNERIESESVLPAAMRVFGGVS
jgi:hypothetical protein